VSPPVVGHEALLTPAIARAALSRTARQRNGAGDIRSVQCRFRARRWAPWHPEM